MPKTSTPVIVYNGWGSYSVYPATVDLARRLVKERVDELGQAAFPGFQLLELMKTAKANPDDVKNPYLVADEIVVRGLKDLVALALGEESRSLYRLSHVGELDKTSKTPVTKELRDQVVWWAFENKVNVEHLRASDLERLRPEQTLLCLKGLVSRAKGHPIQYANAEDLDQAEELRTLLHGEWKPTAKVENVVRRYLAFLNENSHRDEKYELGSFESDETAPKE
jgi:hypothetical protein